MTTAYPIFRATRRQPQCRPEKLRALKSYRILLYFGGINEHSRLIVKARSVDEAIRVTQHNYHVATIGQIDCL
ncbi:MAG: hypothetical protein RL030_2794 [Pseudomonadota bacterium]